ncbi:MAG: ABC transporter substrate-binding protein [Burkholderiales bacterium]|nr:ABC transporter substrate-binding protein [Burkholderiales bacterium]
MKRHCISFERRKLLAAAAGGAVLGFPAIVRGQAGTVRLAHLTPRTGFLGQVGEYGFKGATLAIDEANAAGGVLGRKLELVAEDSVNPATAANKAAKLIERDKVVAIFGEINSASGLAISKEAKRGRRPFFNTGGNSDGLRGKDCNRYMFHVEANSTMYTRTVVDWLTEQGLVKGKRWYALTADYAFGHDLFRVSSKYLGEGGAINVGNDLVPTNTQDWSGYILKIRAARPDFVYSCLAGIDLTNFLKQYKEYNLPFPVTGGANDTALFWLAGIDSSSGFWQTTWCHAIDTPGSRAFTQRFRARFGHPPENQAWQDYIAVRIIVQAMAETKSTDAAKLIAYLEKGAQFDVLKPRKALFNARDHQLMQEMFVVRVKDKAQMQDKWDFFEVLRPSPQPGQPLTALQPSAGENACRMS